MMGYTILREKSTKSSGEYCQDAKKGSNNNDIKRGLSIVDNMYKSL